MKPIQFDTMAVSDPVLQAIDQMNYSEMTEIQARAIPLILAGRDVIGRSCTGTGKTAAFGVPAVELVDSSTRVPQVLVLGPTRELAMQISGELMKYARFKPGVRIATVYGGQAMGIQFRQLRDANVVVGTPGRIMDHMRRGTLRLGEVALVILDEADEMLNMGFVEDIETILQQAPPQRQTLLFSATMPPAILELTRRFQREPELVEVDGGQRTVTAISQYYYPVPQPRKRDALNLLIQAFGGGRSLVFCNTKKMVDDLVAYLTEYGFDAQGLHGDMRQSARTQVMEDFKAGRCEVLVATDVAARGIDVDDIRAVFNFDVPLEDEYYIHRIGRTGRAGREGTAHTLVCGSAQQRRIHDLERYVGAAIERGTMPTPKQAASQQGLRIVETVEEALRDMDRERWTPMLDALLERGHDTREVACALLSMLSGGGRSIAAVEEGASVRPRAWVRLNVGYRNHITPQPILAAITQGAGLPARSVGRIDIETDCTRVEMSHEDAERVVARLNGTMIKGVRTEVSLSEGGYKNNDRGSSRRSFGSASRSTHPPRARRSEG